MTRTRGTFRSMPVYALLLRSPNTDTQHCIRRPVLFMKMRELPAVLGGC